jgi:plastocyanin
MKFNMMVILVLLLLVFSMGCKNKSNIPEDAIPIVEEIIENKTETGSEVPEEWEGKTIKELLEEGGTQDIVDNTSLNETVEEVIEDPKEDILAGTHLIDIQMMGTTFQFFPKKITISRGETVRWTHHMNYQDKKARIAVFARHNNLFRSPQLNYGDYFEYTFNETGSYLFSTVPYTEYFKNGEVIVK